LMTVEWIHDHENLAIPGASGTGKSHFVEALAQAAIEADLRVSGLPCSKRRLPNSDKHPI
jgi:DNA replication protein DnaC